MNKTRHLEKLEHFKAWNPSAAELLEASKRDYEPADTLTRKQHAVTWICALVAAGIMIETLFFKFTGAPESKYIFSKMGTEPWMRWVQGIWELLASIGLLWPHIRWAGGHPHCRRDVCCDPQSLDLAGLVSAGRPRPP